MIDDDRVSSFDDGRSRDGCARRGARVRLKTSTEASRPPSSRLRRETSNPTRPPTSRPRIASRRTRALRATRRVRERRTDRDRDRASTRSVRRAQGDIAMHFENWAGIIVNGFVAFLAPIAIALAATGVTLSCDGVMRALCQPPRLPAPTAINPLPHFCLPYHTNLIAGAFIMVPPTLILAFVYQVGRDVSAIGLCSRVGRSCRRPRCLS